MFCKFRGRDSPSDLVGCRGSRVIRNLFLCCSALLPPRASFLGSRWWQSIATGLECGGGGENFQKEDRSYIARREVWADKNNRSSLCTCARLADFIDVKVLKLDPTDSWYLYPLPFIWTLACCLISRIQ